MGDAETVAMLQSQRRRMMPFGRQIRTIKTKANMKIEPACGTT
jgi:hypothetical protein